MRTRRILSFSLPPTLLREAERLAKKEGRTKSELFREALRRYLQERRWAELRRYGTQQARQLGLVRPTSSASSRSIEKAADAGGSRHQCVHLSPQLRRHA
jgi:CopG family transcriptional regulator/antitoxin EndoAI